MKYFILTILTIASVICFGQNITFCPSEFTTKDDSLKKYISDKYYESKDEYNNHFTSEEKQILKTTLYNRKLKTLSMLESGNFILKGPLFDLVNEIYLEISNKNPSLKEKKIILLKDETANAFTMGEDIIYIHLGLLYRLQNKDQLAFILCHELAHDQLNHFHENLNDYIQEKTDKDLERKIKEIMELKYGHVTNLNTLLVPTLLFKKQKSRINEFEADSLGMTFFKNCKYNSEKACTSFDVFLNADHLRDTSIIDLHKYLNYSTKTINSKRINYQKDESSLGDFTEDISEEDLETKEELNDLLRSHPYEVDRSIKMYRFFNIPIPETFDSTIDTNFKIYRYLAEGEMINYALQSQQIGKALFYSLNMQKNYPNDTYSKLTTSLCMLSLYYYKVNFKEGLVIENQDLENDIAYDKLIYFLKELTPEESFTIGNDLFNSLTIDKKTNESKLIQLLIYYKSNNNTSFKDIYQQNKEEFKKCSHWNFINKMFLEVNKRL